MELFETQNILEIERASNVFKPEPSSSFECWVRYKLKLFTYIKLYNLSSLL